MDIEKGFYWVRIKEVWQPAQYIGSGEWIILGSGSVMKSSFIDEVESKIEMN